MSTTRSSTAVVMGEHLGVRFFISKARPWIEYQRSGAPWSALTTAAAVDEAEKVCDHIRDEWRSGKIDNASAAELFASLSVTFLDALRDNPHTTRIHAELVALREDAAAWERALAEFERQYAGGFR